MKNSKGIVAAGHPITAEAGKIILEAGGNAYDAIAASFFASCLAEPTLSSLGGGGFLMAHEKNGRNTLYDFFVQTPKNKRIEKKLDFFPVDVDFGGAIQTFHIGMASSAVPGSVKGVLQFHSELGKLPIEKVIGPAVKFSREGIGINWFSGLAFQLLKDIYTSQEDTLKLFESRIEKGKLLKEAEVFKNPELGDFLEALARNGSDEFYKGEPARKMVSDMEEKGGLISMEDLSEYKVEKRKPITLNYRGAEFITNPPPSAGGILIAFALKLLEKFNLSKIDFGSPEHIDILSAVMQKAGMVKKGELMMNIRKEGIGEEILSEKFIRGFLDDIIKRVNRWGSTTQMSAIDKEGNMASMTVTNGEGSGYLIPGTGSVINNMLGEEDLNPEGFFKWENDQRISSMMAPSIVIKDEIKMALGSAGSNRLRSAILQIVVNILDFNKDIEEAVNSPRIHYENGMLDMEKGFSEETIKRIKSQFPEANIWNDKNLFFGGANCVMMDGENKVFSGAGDVRREGTWIKAAE